MGTEFQLRKVKIQELDDGESCITMWRYLVPLSRMVKCGENIMFYVMWILPQLKYIYIYIYTARETFKEIQWWTWCRMGRHDDCCNIGQACVMSTYRGSQVRLPGGGGLWPLSLGGWGGWGWGTVWKQGEGEWVFHEEGTGEQKQDWAEQWSLPLMWKCTRLCTDKICPWQVYKTEARQINYPPRVIKTEDFSSVQ